MSSLHDTSAMSKASIISIRFFCFNELLSREDLVNRQKATVLYFSIADNFLYTWLVVPTRGVIKFHQVELTVTEEGTILDEHLQNVRESLGKCEDK